MNMHFYRHAGAVPGSTVIRVHEWAGVLARDLGLKARPRIRWIETAPRPGPGVMPPWQYRVVGWTRQAGLVAEVYLRHDMNDDDLAHGLAHELEHCRQYARYEWLCRQPITDALERAADRYAADACQRVLRRRQCQLCSKAAHAA